MVVRDAFDWLASHPWKTPKRRNVKKAKTGLDRIGAVPAAHGTKKYYDVTLAALSGQRVRWEVIAHERSYLKLYGWHHKLK